MVFGKYLKDNHRFSDPEVVTEFCERFGYTEHMVNKIINDAYPRILTCQVNDFAIFTGVDLKVLWAIAIQSGDN